jgi:hypothetical protein
MPDPVVAREDVALGATVLRSVQLIYRAGADERLDRPAHVRAASSIARFAGRIALIQDDANFVGLLDPATEALQAVTLPPGAGGLRQFDDLRGNKRHKLDLEACLVAPDEQGRELLVAFGSGSSPLRERVVLLSAGVPEPSVELVEAGELYGRLRSTPAFAGSELNVEGAVYRGGRVLLFNRGNGAPGESAGPVDASCELEWSALLAYLRAPRRRPAPAPERVTGYELGAIGGLRLTFTDATEVSGRLLYSAAAEDSPDAVRDGPVAGSAVGVIGRGGARWAALRAPGGELFSGKVEGLLADPAAPRRLLAVVDRDDPRVPSELCEVALDGPWFG